MEFTSRTSSPAGYYEAQLNDPAGQSTMSVWIPLKSPAPTLLGAYQERSHGCRKLAVLVSTFVKCMPAVACAPIVAELPTANPEIGRAAPEMVAEASQIRGIVVIAHGYGDGRLVIAHLAERLASLGFIVGCPMLADSAATPASGLFGRSYFTEKSAKQRKQRMEASVALLQSSFGPQLQVALIGYSLGADTIRHMEIVCPRVYVAGPGWHVKLAESPSELGAAPRGPSVLMLAADDSTMNRMGVTHDLAAAVSGHSLSVRTHIAPEDLEEALRVTPTLVHPTAQLCVIFNGFKHSSFKFPAYNRHENDVWKKLCCGIWIPFRSDEVPLHVMEERSSMSAETVARFLLAIMP